MKEHAHLETWLHLTEQAITCASPAHITYIGAKETLRRIEVSKRASGPSHLQIHYFGTGHRTLTARFRGYGGRRGLG